MSYARGVKNTQHAGASARSVAVTGYERLGALRPRNAARYLGVSLSLFKTLDLPYVLIPGRGVVRQLRVHRIVDLDAFLEQHLVRTGDGPVDRQNVV